MTTRRNFLKGAAASGIAFCSCGMLDAAHAQPKAPRLPVKVNGKRVLTVDVHAHCYFREAINLMGDGADKVLPPVKGVPEHFIAIEQRLKEMDAMAIDMEVLSINPFWYGKDRDTAAQIVKVQNEKLAELCAARPERFARLRFPDAAVSRPRGAAARNGGQETGPSRGRDRRQRAGRGFFRSEIPSRLGQGGRTRRGAVHPSAEHAGTRQALQGQWLAVEHHRQSARHHDRPAAPDLRGNARPLPRAQDHCRAWRRLSRLLRRARRPCLLRVAAKLQSEHHAEEEAVRISQPALFRRHGVHTGRPAPSGGAGRRQPGAARHRPPDPVGAASRSTMSSRPRRFRTSRRSRSWAAMRRGYSG